MPPVEPEELRARVASNIRAIAKRKGLRLTHVADRAEVSKAHLWTVLDGSASPTLDFLARVANGLGVDPGELVRKPRKATK